MLVLKQFQQLLVYIYITRNVNQRLAIYMVISKP